MSLQNILQIDPMLKLMVAALRIRILATSSVALLNAMEKETVPKKCL